MLWIALAAFISADKPHPTRFTPSPWTIFGTNDGGAALVVLPLGSGGTCDSWDAKLDRAPASGPVVVHATRTTIDCGPLPGDREVPGLVGVALGAPLAGRAVTGPLMRQPPRRRGALQEYVVRKARGGRVPGARGPDMVPVPGVIGLTQAQAEPILNAFGFTPLPARGAAASAVIVAQRPTEGVLRLAAKPGRVRLITALASK